MTDYTSTVAQLEALGVPPEKATARARELHPDEAAALDVAAVRRANVLEKEEQRAVRKMALAIGFKVYWLSVPKKHKQTPGLPDLWLAHPRGFAGWWETKRQVGGEFSAAQQEFKAECLHADVAHGSGDRHAFAHWLATNGFTPPSIPRD